MPDDLIRSERNMGREWGKSLISGVRCFVILIPDPVLAFVR